MPDVPAARRRLIGVAYALAAFGAWGLMPLYFKALAHVPALEVVGHRIVWSVILLALLVTLFRRWRSIRAAVTHRRTLLMLLGSTTFISLNWLTFIWAVSVDRVMEISLGYYINPLVNVMLGVLVLRERLNPIQGFALALAAIGVVNLAVQTTGVPWPSLVLAFTFAIYGLIRKTTRLESTEGLFLETTLVAPLALGYLIYLGQSGSGTFATGGLGTDILLLGAGVITALPLIWFATAARRIDYSTVGFVQYVTPTGHFLLAVLMFAEPFTTAHLVTFACIWIALAIFSVDLWRRTRRERAASSEVRAAGE